MTCQDAISFLGDYVDGALPWRQRLVFSWHLAFCRHCREYLSSYAETVRQTRALQGDAAIETENVPAELVQAILAARRSGEYSTSGHDEYRGHD
jgi:anti-sigma factor RsiW